MASCLGRIAVWHEEEVGVHESGPFRLLFDPADFARALVSG